jgi:hypothetical protein
MPSSLCAKRPAPPGERHAHTEPPAMLGPLVCRRQAALESVVERGRPSRCRLTGPPVAGRRNHTRYPHPGAGPARGPQHAESTSSCPAGNPAQKEATCKSAASSMPTPHHLRGQLHPTGVRPAPNRQPDHAGPHTGAAQPPSSSTALSWCPMAQEIQRANTWSSLRQRRAPSH